MKQKVIWPKIGIIAFWILLWQVIALLVHNTVMIAGPWEVLISLLQNIVKGDFRYSVIRSLVRIGAGFFIGLLSGFILAVLSYRFSLLKQFLSPVISVLKSVPVASFIVILLVWFGSDDLAVYVCSLIVFPIIYISVLAGLDSTNRDMIALCDVYHVPFVRRLMFVYRPAVYSSFGATVKTALGMSFRSGVAAEVIGLPRNSLGEQLYLSKIYLDTASLFSWTFVIIVLSVVFEKIILLIINKLFVCHPYPNNSENEVNIESLSAMEAVNPIAEAGRSAGSDEIICSVCGIGKSFEQNAVIRDFSYDFKRNMNYCVMGPSGRGKTTLCKILTGVIAPDTGTIDAPECSVVFQEDLLLLSANAVANVMFANKNVGYERARALLMRLLPEEALGQQTENLSGGMKRRVAVARALASDAPMIVMDEPFTGLDTDTKINVINVIRELTKDKTLIITTHDIDDVALLSAQLLEL